MGFSVADVAAQVLRRAHYTSAGIRTTLFENTGINRVQRSEDVSLWTAGGTQVLTGGQADPRGGTTAYKLDDQDAGISAFRWVALDAFTGADLKRGFRAFLKADTGAIFDFGLYDTAGLAFDCLFRATNTAGVVTVAVAQGAGEVWKVRPLTDRPGWYEMIGQVTVAVPANPHRFYWYGAGSAAPGALGASLLWGAHVDNRAAAHSYIGPTVGASLTVDQDDLQIPWRAAPGAITFYARYYEIGAQKLSVDQGLTQRIIELGQTGASINPRLILLFQSSQLYPRMSHLNAATGADAVALLSSGFPTLAYEDLVEVVGWMYQDGSVQLAAAVNGVAVAASARSAAKTLPVAWASDGLLTTQRVRPFSSVGGAGAVERFAVSPGILTLDEARALR